MPKKKKKSTKLVINSAFEIRLKNAGVKYISEKLKKKMKSTKYIKACVLLLVSK